MKYQKEEKKSTNCYYDLTLLFLNHKLFNAVWMFEFYALVHLPYFKYLLPIAEADSK